MSKFSVYYKTYMSSAAWHRRCIQVHIRDKFICQSCLKNPSTQVHHLTYIHFGSEPLFDLVAVCKECHDQITLLSHRRQKVFDQSGVIENLLKR